MKILKKYFALSGCLWVMKHRHTPGAYLHKSFLKLEDLVPRTQKN